MASKTLSGLLQVVGDESVVKSLLDTVKPKKGQVLSPLQRHAGVLTVGAAINAYPYSLPEWMPQALCFLASKVNEPEPIW